MESRGVRVHCSRLIFGCFSPNDSERRSDIVRKGAREIHVLSWSTAWRELKASELSSIVIGGIHSRTRRELSIMRPRLLFFHAKSQTLILAGLHQRCMDQITHPDQANGASDGQRYVNTAITQHAPLSSCRWIPLPRMVCLRELRNFQHGASGTRWARRTSNIPEPWAIIPLRSCT